MVWIEGVTVTILKGVPFRILQVGDWFKFIHAINTKGVVYAKVSDTTYTRVDGSVLFDVLKGNGDFREVEVVLRGII